MTPHTFRHTFATNMIAVGMEAKTLSTILGHATLAQTMDLYVHISDDMKRTELQKTEEKCIFAGEVVLICFLFVE